MFEFINKLQSKSEIERKQILIGSLVVTMSIVGLVWVSGLGGKFKSEKVAEVSNEIKPFALFGQSISDTYNSVTASVGNISSLSTKKEEAKNVQEEKQIDLIPIEIGN
jgi:hypothetical protein